VLVESHLGQHFVFPGIVREPHSELPVDLGLVLGFGLPQNSGQVRDRAHEPVDLVAGYQAPPPFENAQNLASALARRAWVSVIPWVATAGAPTFGRT